MSTTVQINEQFAAQALANVIELDLDQTKLNMNGGAIALGHPAAASGARIAAHIAHELRFLNFFFYYHSKSPSFLWNRGQMSTRMYAGTRGYRQHQRSHSYT